MTPRRWVLVLGPLVLAAVGSVVLAATQPGADVVARGPLALVPLCIGLGMSGVLGVGFGLHARAGRVRAEHTVELAEATTAAEERGATQSTRPTGGSWPGSTTS